MMKSMIMLFFTIWSILISLLGLNNNNESTEQVVQTPITYELEKDDIAPTQTKEIVKEEIVEEPDPVVVAAEKMQREMEEIESIEDKKEWFLAYKDIVFRYVKWFDPPETVFDVFTEDEVRLICQTVETGETIYEKEVWCDDSRG